MVQIERILYSDCHYIYIKIDLNGVFQLSKCN